MYKTAIDPGHGGSDPGACGHNMRECDIALTVALGVRRYLVDAGYDVAMTRDRDVDVAYPGASAGEELQARCDVSDRFGADVFVSIHVNAAENPAAHGAETFYCAASHRGFRLAECIQSQLVGLGGVNRGVKYTPLYVTSHTQAPAALVEIGFISNPDDAALLADEGWRDDCAAAIARGITDYFAGV